MKYTLPFSMLFLLISGWLGAQAPVTFKSTYTHSRDKLTRFEHILDTGDSIIFATAGRQPSVDINTYTDSSLLFALDRKGAVLWSKAYRVENWPSGQTIGFSDIYPTPDGNLLVCFSASRVQLSIPLYGYGVLKLNKKGEILANYYVDEFDSGGSLTMPTQRDPSNGHFFIMGEKKIIVNSQNIKVNYCVELDENGQLLTGPQHQRYFKPFTGNASWSATFLDSNRDLYAGTVNSTHSTCYILKIPASAAAPTWIQSFTFNGGNNRIFHSTKMDNGLMMWSGGQYFASYATGRIIITDTSGTVLSVKEYKNPTQTLIFMKAIPNNQGFLMACLGGVLMQLDHQGNVLWTRKYVPTTETAESNFFSCSPAADGGYWAVGDYFIKGTNYHYNGLIAKTDENGLVRDCCTDSIPITVTTPSVQVTPMGFNTYNSSVNVIALPFQVADDSFTKGTLCAPENYQFPDDVCTGGCIRVALPKLPKGSSTAWQLPQGATVTNIGTDSVQICFLPQEGTQPVGLQVQLPGNCDPLLYNFEVTIADSDEPLPFALSDSLFCPGSCTQILLTAGSTPTITTPGGQFSSDSLTVCYPDPGIYPITVEQQYKGCQLRHSIEVQVANALDPTPNAFTPNGDTINDGFKPLLDCPPTTYLLQVYDRWGNMVFETDDYNTEWDGTINGKAAPMDAYIWTVKTDNLQLAYKGEVTLIR